MSQETEQQRGIKGAVEEWPVQENEDNSAAFIQKRAAEKMKRAQTLRNRLFVTNLRLLTAMVLWRGVLYKRELASCTASCTGAFY